MRRDSCPPIRSPQNQDLSAQSEADGRDHGTRWVPLNHRYHVITSKLSDCSSEAIADGVFEPATAGRPKLPKTETNPMSWKPEPLPLLRRILATSQRREPARLLTATGNGYGTSRTRTARNRSQRVFMSSDWQRRSACSG